MLGALGDFDTMRYRNGYDKYAAMIMFLLATFIICVVFMNMLIAIMGDTFANVQAVAAENALKEQVRLIDDHIWLLDLRELEAFKNKKHIILLSPDLSISPEEEDITWEVQQVGMSLGKKTD